MHRTLYERWVWVSLVRWVAKSREMGGREMAVYRACLLRQLSEFETRKQSGRHKQTSGQKIYKKGMRYAEWLERRIANAEVATVLYPIPA
jgi:hypothetical protein